MKARHTSLCAYETMGLLFVLPGRGILATPLSNTNGRAVALPSLPVQYTPPASVAPYCLSPARFNDPLCSSSTVYGSASSPTITSMVQPTTRDSSSTSASASVSVKPEENESALSTSKCRAQAGLIGVFSGLSIVLFAGLIWLLVRWFKERRRSNLYSHLETGATPLNEKDPLRSRDDASILPSPAIHLHPSFPGLEFGRVEIGKPKPLGREIGSSQAKMSKIRKFRKGWPQHPFIHTRQDNDHFSVTTLDETVLTDSAHNYVSYAQHCSTNLPESTSKAHRNTLDGMSILRRSRSKFYLLPPLSLDTSSTETHRSFLSSSTKASREMSEIDRQLIAFRASLMLLRKNLGSQSGHESQESMEEPKEYENEVMEEVRWMRDVMDDILTMRE